MSEKSGQENRSVDVFQIKPVSLPATMRKPIAASILARDVFKVFPLLFGTTPDSEAEIVEPDYNFSTQHRGMAVNYIVRPEDLTPAAIAKELQSMKSKGEVIEVDKGTWAEWFLETGKSSPFLKGKGTADWKYPAFKYTLEEIVDILRGKSVFKSVGQVSQTAIAELGTRPSIPLLVSNAGSYKDKGAQIVMDELSKVIKEVTAFVPTAAKREDHLASWEHQTIYYPSKNPVTIIHLFRDLADYYNSPLQRVCVTCGRRIGDPAKCGGLTGIFDDKDGIDLPPDKDIYRWTKIAEQFTRNKPEACITLDDLLKLKTGPAKSVTRAEFRAIQGKYREALLCPNPQCPSRARGVLMIKGPLFHIDHVLQRITESCTIGIPFILVGEPGDGKSEILRQWLTYLYWRFNVPFKILGLEKSITAPKLTAAVNLAKAFSGNPELRDYVLGFVASALITAAFGGEPCNIGLDELNRLLTEDLEWMMPWLASPFEFLLAAAAFMKVVYPNAVNGDKTVWSMGCTMNTRDINNNPLSDAFKERFMMITVGFEGAEGDFRVKDIIRLRNHIEYDKSKMQDPHDHWIIKYLYEIFKLTETMQTNRETRFKSGIRQLERIHQVFMRAIEMRTRTFGIYEGDINASVNSIEKMPDEWGSKKATVQQINPFSKKEDAKKTTELVIKEIFSDVVKTNLLNNIMEENNEVKTKKIQARWEQFIGNATFWNIIKQGLAADKIVTF